jgi:hypothetical protein
MMMREMSAGTLCVVIIVCLSLTSVASEASLEDGVNSGWWIPTLIETDNLGSAISPQVVVDDSDAVYSVAVDPSLSLLPLWTAECNQTDAEFGWSVASAGDVNGDGIEDVIVGAHSYDNGETDEGRAYLYLGSASGFSATPSWTAEGNQAYAHFGISVASAGDVNGDGYDDVIVGADRYDDGETNEGRAFLYLGSASGLSATPSWTADGNNWDAFFGISVASAGDVNDDGYDDVVVGAYLYQYGISRIGRAYLYLGSASGLSATSSWIAEGDQTGALFGYSVASAGDVNDDGYDDVVVGAYSYDNGEVDEGRAYLYLGSSSGLSVTPSWTAEGNQAGAYFGISVASAGDVNGDGYDDVVVGASWYDNGETQEGRAYLYLGSASGLSATPSWTAESDHTEAFFGHSVASAGDVNGDGYDEVVVGALGYSNAFAVNDGRIYLYLGSALGLSPTPSWTAESDQVDARLGYSVASAGDVNGDGYDDVIVGTPRYDNGETNEGRASLYMRFNGPPIADAGANKTAIVGEVVTFDGSDSCDDIGIENYTWTFTYDDEVREMYGVSPMFAFDIAGIYVVMLTVEDAEGEADTDEVTITVEEEQEDEDEKNFIESYGLLLGIVVALVIIALLLFFVLKGRKSGGTPTSIEELPAGESGAHR